MHNITDKNLQLRFLWYLAIETLTTRSVSNVGKEKQCCQFVAIVYIVTLLNFFFILKRLSVAKIDVVLLLPCLIHSHSDFCEKSNVTNLLITI